MILFSFGTIEYPFFRLKNFLESNLNNISENKIVIQNGFTKIELPKTQKEVLVVKFIPFDKMNVLYTSSNKVVLSSGEGSLIHSLEYSKHKPILYPRRADYGEHVDMQQVQIAEAAQNKNLAYYAESDSRLLEYINSKVERNAKMGNMINHTSKLSDRFVKEFS